MSLDATRWAWKQKLSATQKIVLLCMADRAGRQHTCWPSTMRLSRDTGLTERTIFNILNHLEGMSIIRRQVRPGRSTIYHLIGVTRRDVHGDVERDVHGDVERDVYGAMGRDVHGDVGRDVHGDGHGGAQALLGQRLPQDEISPCMACTPESDAGHPCTTCIPPLNNVHLESIRESYKESREREARPQALAHALVSACAMGSQPGSQPGSPSGSQPGSPSGSQPGSPSGGQPEGQPGSQAVGQCSRQPAGQSGSAQARSGSQSVHASGRPLRPQRAGKAAQSDSPPKIAHGEHAHVLLTEAEHAKLMASYGQEWTHEAITLLDLHIDAGGKNTYISHCAALQKWVFDAINERRLKLRMSPFTRPAPMSSASSASVLPSSVSTGSLGSSSSTGSWCGQTQRQASIKQPYDYEPTPEELVRNREAARNIRQKYFRDRQPNDG